MTKAERPGGGASSALGVEFLAAAARNPDAPHLQLLTSAGELIVRTYGQTAAAARTIASALLCSGLQPGAAVAVLGDASPLEVEASVGVWLAGGVLVPLDPQWSPEAHGRGLDKANVRFGLSLPGRADHLTSAARGLPEFLHLEAEEVLRSTDAGVRLPRVDDSSPALILFTSGTTGAPKAAVLSHRALAWNARTVLNLVEAGPEDNFLNVLPLHHAFGLMVTVLVPPLRGARATFPPSLKGPDITKTMRRTGITIVAAVPQLMAGFDRAIQQKVRELGAPARSAFRFALRGSGFVRDRLGWNLGRTLFQRIHEQIGPKLRYLGSAGAALDPDVARRLRAVGMNVCEGYGLTEAGPAIAFEQGLRPRYGSVGKPLPGVEVRIDKPDEHGVGEVVARSPSLFDGYLDDEEATSAVLRDGWLYTGDLGRLDDEGRLFITGRSKEVVVLGSGKNVYPHEVEARLDECPFIAESCVLGLRDGDRPGTEKLHAVIVPDFDALRKAGISRIGVTLSDEIVALGDKLPSHHRVVGITVRANPLPRTALGKLKRFEVDADLKAERAGRPAAARTTDERPPESEYWSAVEGALRQVSGHEGAIVGSTGLELDLGLDSLARVEALALLEERLGTSLPEGFGGDALTAGEVLAAVETFLQQGGAARAEQLTAPGATTIADLRSWKRTLARPFGLLLVAVAYWPMLLLAKLLWRFEVNGREHLPEGPFLICPNHGSYLDAAVMQFAIPYRTLARTWALGDYDIFGSLPMRLLAVLGHVVRLDAGSGLRATLDKGGAILGAGWPLLLFPEGTRAPEGERLPFRRGAAILARTAKVRIVPTWLEGVDRLMPRGTFKISAGHRVAVRFGEPIDPTVVDGEADPALALTELLRRRIGELAEEERRYAERRDAGRAGKR